MVEIIPLLKSEMKRDWFRIRITDHGSGIKPEDLELLGRKAVQNTSNPSNPRLASAEDYQEMFGREIARQRGALAS